MGYKGTGQAPRSDVQSKIPVDVLASLGPLRRAREQPFDSFSKFLSAILLWIDAIYLEEHGEDIIQRMKELKASRFLSLPSMSEHVPCKAVHLTLETRCLDIANAFLKRYPVLFRNRNEFFTLCICYAAQYCTALDSTLR